VGYSFRADEEEHAVLAQAKREAQGCQSSLLGKGRKKGREEGGRERDGRKIQGKPKN
jgi:hypothetical protein